MTPPSLAHDTIFPSIGYQTPQYTQIPDLLLDFQMAHMTGAELKVALYICRRTFGFKKNSDTISFNQMLDGIVTRDGRRLDYGTGLSRDALAKAIKGLEAKRVILVLRSEDEKGSKQTNLYALNVGQACAMPDAPEEASRLGAGQVGGSPKNGLGGSPKNGLGGSPKNGLTINSNNNKQYNNRQNNSSDTPHDQLADLNSHKQAVVVALTSFGLSERVALRLATRYSEKRIREKIAFLVFLQEQDAVDRPAGWLRMAIIDDYARPDGFLSQRERDETREAEEAHNQSLHAHQAESRRTEEDRQAALRAERQEQLQRLRRMYSVQQDDLDFGVELMNAMKSVSVDGGLLQSLLPSMEFLKWDAGQAVFAVTDEFVRGKLQHPGTQTAIKRTIRFLLRTRHPDLKLEDITLEFCIIGADFFAAKPIVRMHKGTLGASGEALNAPPGSGSGTSG